MTDCEYFKFGCKTKLSNSDHLAAHIEHFATTHLKLVVAVLETEIDKNKKLNEKVDNLERIFKEQDSLFRTLEKRVSELASRPLSAAVPDIVVTKEVAPPKSSVGNGPSPRGSSIEDSASKIEARARFFSAGPAASSAKPSISEPPKVEKVPEPKPVASIIPEPTQSTRPDSSVPARAHNSSSNSLLPEQSKGHTLSSNVVKTEERHSSARPKSTTLTKSGLPDVGYEFGIIWEYDAVTDEWTRGLCKVKFDPNPFAEGSLRMAHLCDIVESLNDAVDFPSDTSVGDKPIKRGVLPIGIGLMGTKYVAKLSKTKVPIERYFEDVRMQMQCQELGKMFNQQGTPKKVDFLHAWVLEIPRTTVMFCGLEPHIEGEFIKHANNTGMILTDRNTPQAFSHFSWEKSRHALLVVDLQGVKDYYTDPQIHTKDGKGYGLGNLGTSGIDRFLKTHKCNAICQMLNLPAINPLPESNAARKKLMKGTMQCPYIEDQLAKAVLPKLDMPDPFVRGEFQCIQTLSGHEDRVISLAISPKYLFSASSDGVVKVWNLPNYSLSTTINAHRKSVECMAVSEKFLFTGSSDHSVKVWDFEGFNMVATMRDHLGDVNAICLTDKTIGYLISASFDKTVKLWNTRTWKCVNTFEGHTKSVKTLAISGSILFSGSNDGSIMVWNLKYMSNIFTVQAHDGWVKTLQVKDRSLYSGGYDYLIKEWDLTSFANTNTFSEHNDNVSQLLITERYLISASEDQTIMVWDVITKKIVTTVKGHRLGVQALTTDGRHIISGSDDYSVKVWRYSTL